MQRLVISKKALETIGTHSVQGMAMSQGLVPGPLTLVFQGSSRAYCRENDGPELVIMPDYVPYCLIESVLNMQKIGWIISVEIDESH